MDHFEMTEKLVEKTGTTFEEAKAALEASGWDMLDAVILLEKQGKTAAKSGSYTSKAGKAPADEAVELEDLEDSYDKSRFKHAKDGSGEGKDGFRRFLEKARIFLFENKLLVFNGKGKEIVNMPILFAGLIFLFAFWLVLILVMLSLVKGWRYRFSGKDLGKDSVNGVADAVGDAVEKMGKDIKEKINEKKES